MRRKYLSNIWFSLHVSEEPPPPIKPCNTSFPSSLPNASENERPHAEKKPKKERFSPLFSIFGGAVENGEKWRKSMVFHRFLSMWWFVFTRVWQGGSEGGLEGIEWSLMKNHSQHSENWHKNRRKFPSRKNTKFSMIHSWTVKYCFQKALVPLTTSFTSFHPSWNEKDSPHTEKTMKNHRFSPLCSIFDRTPKNGEKWRKSLLFRGFLGVWLFVFTRVWRRGREGGLAWFGWWRLLCWVDRLNNYNHFLFLRSSWPSQVCILFQRKRKRGDRRK